MGSGIGSWFGIEDYQFCIHDLKDRTVFDNGILEPHHVRSVRILVEYRNESRQSLRHSMMQWMVCDRSGFCYESEIRTQFYEEDAPRRLKEGMVAPGERIRGWVAFSPTQFAVLSVVKFRSSGMSDRVLSIPLT
ncbi:MAG: hypothetical protein OHK0022_02600 [Roseiflexaceae bacterium]